jgi:succinylglutamate desuccinylase
MNWAESAEQVELLSHMKEFMNGDQETYFIDLHTTSGESMPFMSVSDTAANRGFVKKFNIPAVLGIEEYIEGPLLNYASAKGHVSVAFEAGQHSSPNAVRNHRCFVKQVLAELDMTQAISWNALDEGLDENLFTVVHREVVSPEREFAMKPGFENFQTIKKGEVLAQDVHGEIVSEHDGRIFMPLYQKEGTDGFFIIK